MKIRTMDKAVTKITAISLLSSFAFVTWAGDETKHRVLSFSEAGAVVVAMQHESAKRCQAECFVLVSSENGYSKVTFANRIEEQIGSNQKGLRYTNGVTLYINNLSRRIDKVVVNR